MKTLKFDTSLKCEGCVAKIQPIFDENTAIENWSVDLSKQPKELTVQTENLNADDIISLLNEAGYKGSEK